MSVPLPQMGQQRLRDVKLPTQSHTALREDALFKSAGEPAEVLGVLCKGFRRCLSSGSRFGVDPDRALVWPHSLRPH